MAQPGFIHDKLDIKLLILYIMARVTAPIDLPTLTDLALCDAGVDYFLFAEFVSELVGSGHLTLENDAYSITEKGRKHGEITESSLPYSVRLKCTRALSQLNKQLRRNAQVRSKLLSREDGLCTLQLALDDNDGSLFSLELLVATEEQGKHIASRFQAAPDQIYNDILTILLTSRTEKQGD